jgi:putative transposase
MADELRMALAELLRKADLGGDVDFLRAGVRLLAPQLREPEVSQHLGADRYQRTPERGGERNG